MKKEPPSVAVILAAGKGTRMRSSKPKVLHEVCGKAMLSWCIEAAKTVCDDVLVGLGHKREDVRAHLPEGTLEAVQDPPKGTGDALRVASEKLPSEGVVIVLPSDAPLIQAATLQRLLESHQEALCTVLTAHIKPQESATSGYGRIVRDDKGQCLRIVEAAHASEKEKMLTEVNTGIYAFDASWLYVEVLPFLEAHPPKGEYYLTDAIEKAALSGRLQAIEHDDLTEVTGVNDREALAQLEELARQQINSDWMKKGVRFVDPKCTYVDAEVVLSADVELGPGVVLKGTTRIGEGAHIGAYCHLRNCEVDAHATVLPLSVADSAHIGPHSSVGPFARLREGTVLEEGSKVGNFVEIKKTRLGPGAKANHLSYLGDSDIGSKANIGAGTITCNYDGHNKHSTTIGANAFIGSNSALVAPVTIGDGAIVGAGSTINQNVPNNALGIARAKQANVPDLASLIHAKNKQDQDSEK